MEFGNCEIPYRDSLGNSFNTWNPYERNHWGYMTSNFFAPSSYYSMDWDEFKWNKWMGADGSQVKQFKDMVKAFHKEGIGVMMDVVYNHLSEYEIGNLKQIDKEYYFRLDSNSNFIAQSGCGNDIKTERPMMRRMIVESLIYWMKEYHIDGFRFDLGKLIDWETVEEIIRETRKVNPNVVIVCEPWGGGYDPAGFSLREWGSWNDQIRNGIKGENPKDGLGWIFGEWYGNNNKDRIKSYVNGTIVDYKHGLFQKKEHAVNYLASHDGYTLGDFIRIGTKQVKADQVIKDVDQNALLTEKQLKLNKLGALFLLTSQGITMIHAGQEFARSKVIPLDIDVEDKHKGMIDHNSYEKDNAVNYINFEHAASNKELFDYYNGLIELRKKYKAFRHADPKDIMFFDVTESEFALAYAIEFGDDTFLVLLNADQSKAEKFVLPQGNWDVLVDDKKAGTKKLSGLTGKIEVKPVSGVVLKKN
jgi:pullulanase/glycogen debranching enzyme